MKTCVICPTSLGLGAFAIKHDAIQRLMVPTAGREIARGTIAGLRWQQGAVPLR